ncbi:TniB family NTP-binding protein [Pseudomonas putida]|uniref:TniB family NTP-binding protein n=1 Tax=Pseudomonas putida TaxID=303 RepID=UPI000CD3CD0C|nr:TniB family NTP-binding protein [Pseudomonas putida]POF96578.1 transposase [Pseudomonas putida]
MPYEHLEESRRFAMELSKRERMDFMRKDVVISTEHLRNIRTIAYNMIHIPRGCMEAPCLIVTAESNYGKSTICNAVRGLDQEWCRKIRYVNFVRDTKNTRVRPRPGEKLMSALGLDPGKTGIDIKTITDYCLSSDVRAIFMDEFQDSILQLSNQEQLAFLSMLRGMCGPPLYMSFFVFGVAEAANALDSDAQYQRRFEKYEITRWKQSDAEYLNFLDTWESIMPLAFPSDLSSPELNAEIYFQTQGVIGRICDVLKAAGAYAISSGKEKITIDTLKQAGKSKWLQELPG